ncbi:unnamed protein product [Tilletia controversa]|nr:unnamed protein product [Tilletia controversa]CAD6916595.1 unnamed protein product [Tilletia controversa]
MSFALLLALLAKARVLFSQPASLSSSSEERQQQHGIASIIIVPSNELAFQYYSWARALLPQAGDELHPIMRVLVRAHPTSSAQDQLDLPRKTPPHLIVATPTLLLNPTPPISTRLRDHHALARAPRACASQL